MRVDEWLPETRTSVGEGWREGWLMGMEAQLDRRNNFQCSKA